MVFEAVFAAISFCFRLSGFQDNTNVHQKYLGFAELDESGCETVASFLDVFLSSRSTPVFSDALHFIFGDVESSLNDFRFR